LPCILNTTYLNLEYLLYYKCIVSSTLNSISILNSSAQITLTQLIFASNYIQQLLKQLNLLNESLKIRTLISNNISYIKKTKYTKALNLLNLCILNNIQPY